MSLRADSSDGLELRAKFTDGSTSGDAEKGMTSGGGHWLKLRQTSKPSSPTQIQKRLWMTIVIRRESARKVPRKSIRRARLSG